MDNYLTDSERILKVLTEIRDLLKQQVYPPKQDVLVTCPRCLGTGNDSRSTSATCGFCNGNGQVMTKS